LILLILLSVIIIFYMSIISTILCITMDRNRKKAFSTYVSYLTVVIFFSAILFMYAQARSIHSLDLHRLVSIIYSIITPLLNPFIYCLRNQEEK
ncbi:OR6B1 protein, partial [Chunga burmeisteri]|nr:OR6B1 protein [Chunga burmeisteri]